MTVEPRPLPCAVADVLWRAGDPLHGGVGPAELAAMVHDGQIRPLLGPVFLSTGAPATRLVKARAIQLLIPAGLWRCGLLHRDAAAWFFSCAPSPETLHFLVHREQRTTMRPSPGSAALAWEVRQMVYPAEDVDHFHGLRTTTPRRTAADLACWNRPAAFEQLCTMLSVPHLCVDPQAVVHLLRNRPRLPERDRGIMRVRRAARQLGLSVPD